jgi:hypothetical protein
MTKEEENKKTGKYHVSSVFLFKTEKKQKNLD